MITFDEIRAKYPPRKVETQHEFDSMMNALRLEHNQLTAPLQQHLDELNLRRREIGRQMAQLNIELANVNHERDTMHDELKRIGGIFFLLKKQLIQANPIVSPQPQQEGEQ